MTAGPLLWLGPTAGSSIGAWAGCWACSDGLGSEGMCYDWAAGPVTGWRCSSLKALTHQSDLALSAHMLDGFPQPPRSSSKLGSECAEGYSAFAAPR